MTTSPDFHIRSDKEISAAFLGRNISTFNEAADYICKLPYRRNADKNKLVTVFADGCGTCGTKHALLKQLADENGIDGFRLIMGVYKMSAANTKPVAGILAQHQLEYVPEAHNYLRFHGQVLDYTKPGFSVVNFLHDVMEETEITPGQISDFKVAYHKDFIRRWIDGQPGFPYTTEETWAIKESCIHALSL